MLPIVPVMQLSMLMRGRWVRALITVPAAACLDMACRTSLAMIFFKALWWRPA
jgi:hypothetical protein